MILLAFRHGLRAGEVVDLQWEQIDFAGAVLHVRRSRMDRPPRIPSPVANSAPYDSISARAAEALRLCLGTRRSPQPCGVQSDGGARREGRRPGSKGPRTHAAPRLRLRTSERGARHEGLAGVPRAPEYPEHGEIFRACAWALLGVLAGLARRRSPGCTHGPGLPRLNDQSPY